MVVKPGVPLSHRGVDGNGRHNWQGHGQNDLQEDAHGARAVDHGAFLHRNRQLLHIGFNQDNIIGVHHGRQDVYQEGVGQAIGLVYQICGDQAAAHIHGDYQDAVHHLAQGHILLGKQIAQQHAGQQRTGRADACAQHGNQKGMGNIAAFENIGIILQGKVDRPGHGVHRQRARGKRLNEDIPQRVQAQRDDHQEKQDIEDIENLTGHGIMMYHFLFFLLTQWIRRARAWPAGWSVSAT